MYVRQLNVYIPVGTEADTYISDILIHMIINIVLCILNILSSINISVAEFCHPVSKFFNILVYIAKYTPKRMENPEFLCLLPRRHHWDETTDISKKFWHIVAAKFFPCGRINKWIKMLIQFHPYCIKYLWYTWLSQLVNSKNKYSKQGMESFWITVYQLNFSCLVEYP